MQTVLKLNIEEKVNSKRKGSFLEFVIKKIFDCSGFKTKLNPTIKGKEIDVLAIILGKIILISCKQYEKSSLPVSDFIHTSYSIKQTIGADALILVLWGYPNIKDEDGRLAKEKRIVIWNDYKIVHYIHMAFSCDKHIKQQLFLEIGIDEERAEKYYSEKIKEIEKSSFPKQLKEKIFEAKNNWMTHSTYISPKSELGMWLNSYEPVAYTIIDKLLEEDGMKIKRNSGSIILIKE